MANGKFLFAVARLQGGAFNALMRHQIEAQSFL
jgi:hypothetical protein